MFVSQPGRHIGNMAAIPLDPFSPFISRTLVKSTFQSYSNTLERESTRFVYWYFICTVLRRYEQYRVPFSFTFQEVRDLCYDTHPFISAFSLNTIHTLWVSRYETLGNYASRGLCWSRLMPPEVSPLLQPVDKTLTMKATILVDSQQDGISPIQLYPCTRNNPRPRQATGPQQRHNLKTWRYYDESKRSPAR